MESHDKHGLYARKRVIRMNSLKEKVEDVEKEEIVNALKECNWIMARAARRLGITERMIGYKIKKYGIKKEVTYTLSSGEQGQ
ncbi:MAG TPA: helix-turn-helix domain-containing protein [Thermodesulfovibrionales bacterium]|nr:helix-turn-helix domain-containing protein [Thermodesulfovibrionales bacterium]